MMREQPNNYRNNLVFCGAERSQLNTNVNAMTTSVERRAKSPSSLDIRPPLKNCNTGPLQDDHRSDSFPHITVSPGASITPTTSQMTLSPYTIHAKGIDTVDIDQLSLLGNVGLLRSVSARTLDSQLETLPVSSEESHERLSRGSPDSITPFYNDGNLQIAPIRWRASSCPEISYPLIRSKDTALDFHPSLNSDFVPDFVLPETGNSKEPLLANEVDSDSINLNFPLHLSHDGWNIKHMPGDRSPKAVSPSLPCTCRTIKSFTLKNRTRDRSKGGVIPCPSCQSQNCPVSEAKYKSDKEKNSESGQHSENRRRTSKEMDATGNKKSRSYSAKEKCLRWLKSLSVDRP